MGLDEGTVVFAADSQPSPSVAGMHNVSTQARRNSTTSELGKLVELNDHPLRADEEGYDTEACQMEESNVEVIKTPLKLQWEISPWMKTSHRPRRA